MSRIAMLLVCLGALTATGCKRQPAVELTNASMDEVVERQATVARMLPGQWEVTVETLDVKAGAGTSPMPHPAATTTRTCLTARQVEQPAAMLGDGLMQAFRNSCRYDRFTMKDGRIDTEMRCVLPDGQKIAAATHGGFTPTTLAVESESEVGGPGSGTLATRIRMNGRRVGACPARGG